LSTAATATIPFNATTPLPTAGALVKQGDGVWNLTGNSELSGTVLVSAGEVSMNGSMRGNTVFVQGTSILSGAGDLASNTGVLSNVTVQSGSFLSPGAAGSSGTTQGMITVLDDLRTLSGSNVNLNLNGSTLNAPGLIAAINTSPAAYDSYISGILASWEATLANGVATANHDRISIIGNFQHDAGAKINVSFNTGYTPVAGDIFDLIDWATLNVGGFGANLLTATGTTSYGNGLLTSGGVHGDLTLPTLTGGLNWDVQLIQSHGIAIIVPEPSRLLLLCLGVSLLGLRRRRA
jgi:autotransporter-associated beta strand protein